MGVNRHGPDAEFMGRPKNAYGNFAAIGDKQLFDWFHRYHSYVRVPSLETCSQGKSERCPAGVSAVDMES
jgi:hypothetical protein